MGLRKFTEISSLSNSEILQTIKQTEKNLFEIQFKKATRQNFKSHEIKHNKRKLAQLKTLLKLKVETLEQKNNIS